MTRVRGMAPWEPRAKTRPLLGNVLEVLHQYREQLPLTLRQIFYRLVAAFEYEKTEQAYGRLGEMVNRARRGETIRFDVIRDDGFINQWPTGFASREDFWNGVDKLIAQFQLKRQEGQAQFLEVWVEASGMVPQVFRATGESGVPVFSSSGFDSTTVKYEAAQRFLDRDVPTVVLHVGDYDPSGVALFENVREDVTAFYEDLGGEEPPEFERVAVTLDQIERLRLPTAPPKKSDKRGAFNDTKTVQAEALPPDVLQAEVMAVIEGYVDREVMDALAERERRERELLITDAQTKRADEEGEDK
jgi:hypothetical protein